MFFFFFSLFLLCFFFLFLFCLFFFFKQKTAYEIYQCDWSSDVCSSDLCQRRITKIATRGWRVTVLCYYAIDKGS